MDGTLIIEVYEYMGDFSAYPDFEYYPCDLSRCLKGKSATLKEIIQRGFGELPRRTQDTEKRQEVLRKLEAAQIGKIDVAYHPPKAGREPYVELTNVIPVNLTYADALRGKQSKDSIILKGKYKLSTGNEVTTLKDAQRLTLSYYDTIESNGGDSSDEEAVQREICLNITYLRDL